MTQEIYKLIIADHFSYLVTNLYPQRIMLGINVQRKTIKKILYRIFKLCFRKIGNYFAGICFKVGRTFFFFNLKNMKKYYTIL